MAGFSFTLMLSSLINGQIIEEDPHLSTIVHTSWLKGARHSANFMLTAAFLMLTAEQRALHPKSALIQI